MFGRTKKLIKSILGENFLHKIRPKYHGLKTYFSALRNGFPAKKLKIIGITGTKGKTSTTVLTGRLLNNLGVKTGFISTASVSLDGEEEFLNPYKMTTIDGSILHKYLKKMVKNGCQWVVLEMSSQGLEQNRHVGLGSFDVGVFLNLYPEHLEAHGGIESYIKNKTKLFEKLDPGGVFIGNGEFEETEKMWKAIPEDCCRVPKKVLLREGRDYKIIDNKYGLFKLLKIEENEIKTNFYANFEVVNLAFAVKIAEIASKESLNKILEKASELKDISGRMEFVVKGEKVDIIVDYAHEPEGMKQLLETLKDWKNKELYKNIVHVVSCDGVGRDDWKKPILGDLSYENADFTVVTTDNYETKDNPEDIVKILSQNYNSEFEGKKYIKTVDRKEGFEKALQWARENSDSENRAVIVSTGVGVEHGLTQPSGTMEWDEREVWREVAGGNN